MQRSAGPRSTARLFEMPVALMKKIDDLCMIFAQFVFSQTCPDDVDNGQFLRLEECYK